MTALVEVSDEVMPGVVSLPHGWGHDADGTRLAVAERRPGVNMNRLVDGGVLDPLSGNARINGVPVEVSRGEVGLGQPRQVPCTLTVRLMRSRLPRDRSASARPSQASSMSMCST